MGYVSFREGMVYFSMYCITHPLEFKEFTFDHQIPWIRVMNVAMNRVNNGLICGSTDPLEVHEKRAPGCVGFFLDAIRSPVI